MNHNSTQNKLIHTIHAAAGAIALIAFASTASAQITIDTSYVGDVGNANDSTGYGGVDYGYYIGTYEVTNNQYVSFLNEVGASNTHGVFDSRMESDSLRGGIQQDGTSGNFSYSVKAGTGLRPVNYVSFWDAARFTNWLTSGDTEVGVYNLNGESNPVNTAITRDAATWEAGGVAVSSEDEWYKAAFYDPTLNGDTGGYWDYAHQSDTITTDDANYGDDISDGVATDVGSYGDSDSYYGTFDQSGNSWEWNDQIVASANRGLRGGANIGDDTNLLSSSYRGSSDAAGTALHFGFRITTLDANAVPEPSTYAAMLGVIALAFVSIRRKGRSASSNL